MDCSGLGKCRRLQNKSFSLNRFSVDHIKMKHDSSDCSGQDIFHVLRFP